MTLKYNSLYSTGHRITCLKDKFSKLEQVSALPSKGDAQNHHEQILTEDRPMIYPFYKETIEILSHIWSNRNAYRTSNNIYMQSSS